MKMTTVVLMISLVALTILGSASAFFRDCGRQAGGARCPRSECCSQHGFCGRTEQHCSDKYACQLDCWRHERPDERCGPAFNNPPCGRNRCCSRNNWCGGSAGHCAAGNCQYNCWPTKSTLQTDPDAVTDTDTPSLELLSHILMPAEAE